MKPTLLVVAGPNGSGKTTITKELRQHTWASGRDYLNPDDIAQKDFGDWNSHDAVLKAAQYADMLREEYLQRKQSLLFESVFSTPSKLDFVQRAVDAGFFVRLFFICTDNTDINVARIAQRVREGGHHVPTEKVIERYYRAIAYGSQAARYVHRAYFYDTSTENAPAQLLFRMRNGSIAKVYEAAFIPAWSKVVRDALGSLKS